jgi:hypothetical protein
VSTAVVSCPSCGTENPAGFRLCGMCGVALGAEQAPRREERKVVSIVFCDVVGATTYVRRGEALLAATG